MIYKICTLCKESKPSEAFTKASAGKGDRHGLVARCKVCRSADNMKWHAKNSVRSRELHAQWQLANLESERAKARERGRRDPAKRFADARMWRQRNPAANAAKSQRYETRKLEAMPAWLSAIQLAQIDEFYEIAAARAAQTNIPHQVDHIHALKGENFRGLHVPWNLQVLTATENRTKKNRMGVAT